LQLSIGQGLEVGTASPYWRALPRELLEQPFRDGGREERCPARRHPDPVDELLWRDVLEQKTTRAGRQSVEDVFVQVVSGEDHDLAGRAGFSQAPRRLDA